MVDVGFEFDVSIIDVELTMVEDVALLDVVTIEELDDVVVVDENMLVDEVEFEVNILEREDVVDELVVTETEESIGPVNWVGCGVPTRHPMVYGYSKVAS